MLSTIHVSELSQVFDNLSQIISDYKLQEILFIWL